MELVKVPSPTLPGPRTRTRTHTHTQHTYTYLAPSLSPPPSHHTHSRIPLRGRNAGPRPLQHVPRLAREQGAAAAGHVGRDALRPVRLNTPLRPCAAPSALSPHSHPPSRTPTPPPPPTRTHAHRCRWDWAGLRANIAQYGIRNSLLLAPMPTASTAQVRVTSSLVDPHLVPM
jgi:hypothetical protein